MEFPLSVLQQVKEWDLPSATTDKPKKIKNASVSGEYRKLPDKEKPAPVESKVSKEKIKAIANNKQPTSIDVKSDNRPPTRKPVQVVAKREKRPPAPIKWRSRNINGDDSHTKHWAYKRNYMACYVQGDGECFPYEIWEISDKHKHKLVLSVEYCTVFEGLVERLENFIRTLAKGYDITLTEYEEVHGKFIKENIKFVPYEETEQPTLTAEEERIKNAQEEDRLMKLLAERRNKINVQSN